MATTPDADGVVQPNGAADTATAGDGYETKPLVAAVAVTTTNAGGVAPKTATIASSSSSSAPQSSSSTTPPAATRAAATAKGASRPKPYKREQPSQDESDRAAALAASFKKLNRFSDIEKALLYAQFKEHQQIIDIKQRRSSYSSHKQAEVRACWERIVDEYNAHPETQNRTMRQIQKFWLNSK